MSWLPLLIPTYAWAGESYAAFGWFFIIIGLIAFGPILFIFFYLVGWEAFFGPDRNPPLPPRDEEPKE